MNTARRTLGLTLAALLVAAAEAAAQAGQGINPDCEKLLPVAVVSQAVAGEVDVALVPRDGAGGAGGTCNYARDAGGMKLMVLLVNIHRWGGQQEFARYKGHAMYQRDQRPVTELGDEAFSTGETIVAARKGPLVIVLSTFQDIDLTTATPKGSYLTRAQLIELARQMLATP